MEPAIFGYIRVSQAEGESGLATQRRILNDHGLRDDRIYTDMISGKNMRRPAWTQLREMLWPGDGVVVPSRESTGWRVTSRRVSGPSRSCTIRGSTSAPCRGPRHRGRQSHLQANAAHALVLGRVGEGLHPGPDQGRRGPRRGRGKDGRQAPGAGLREAAGRPGLPSQQQRQRQRGTPDLQGEPGDRQGRQGRDLQGTTRHDAAGRPLLTSMPYNSPALHPSHPARGTP